MRRLPKFSLMGTDAGEESDDQAHRPAQVVAGQLNDLIGQVEEILGDEGLLPPPCDGSQ